jgi:hypothetical protein
MKTLAKRRAPRHRGLTPTERRVRQLLDFLREAENNDAMIQNPGAAVMASAELNYRLSRIATRPFRRAFGGNRRAIHALGLQARQRYELDQGDVRQAVILGARTIPDLVRETGFRERYLRQIVEREELKAVTL